jgi:uncharacterized protein
MQTVKEEPGVKVNTLYPVFLKLEFLHVLIVGGGPVAFEKLSNILANSPLTKIRLVSIDIIPEIYQLVEAHPFIDLQLSNFSKRHLEGIDLVISAVNNVELAKLIRKEVKEQRILFNAADKPALCDFYLGSTVTKGDLKIAISTNGKSPTMAKRIKETLNEVFPEETNELIDNLHHIRNELKGDFHYKVKVLNTLTKEMRIPIQTKKQQSKTKKALLFSVLVLMSMLLGHILLSYVPFANVQELAHDIWVHLDANFGWFLLIGFVAQMIDGALGMAYGVSVTTGLMSLGIPFVTPAIASASMHASEIFTTGSSSLVYMRHKNVNQKMFKALAWPGIIGAVLGGVTVCLFSKEYFIVLRPFVGVYTLILGVLILRRALITSKVKRKIKKLTPLALTGGFLDSVGGGGWGPIVTSSLLAGGRHLKYAVGSAHLAKFFVALASTITFFCFLGLSHWQIIFGLVVGGMLAAPISIAISNKIPVKKGLVLVGLLIIGLSIHTILK